LDPALGMTSSRAGALPHLECISNVGASLLAKAIDLSTDLPWQRFSTAHKKGRFRMKTACPK
ncbi:hypothetical protein, partial [Pseudomonas sp. PS01270]|uniref:hypothetical protein n=1 Tax=Pseudomonas sp. PS01270 TaxID=2991431 RepID=UPI00249AB9AB